MKPWRMLRQKKQQFHLQSRTLQSGQKGYSKLQKVLLQLTLYTSTLLLLKSLLHMKCSW